MALKIQILLAARKFAKGFAKELWGKDGSKYDGCGMMMWVADPE